MKKEQLTHTIIYSLLLTACITLAIILTLASCTGAPEAGEPGFPADKTPLTLGNIALAETGQPWTRQTPEEFFVEDDVLTLIANASDASHQKQTTFAYHPDAPGGNPWTLTGEPLYYEDVAEDYNFHLEFGNPSLTDQSAGTHPADYIRGTATLNGPTITCTTMERQHTQINIVLTKGDDWGDTNFQHYLDDCTFHFLVGFTPYTTFDAGEQTLTCSVIFPRSAWQGFTLTTPAGRQQTLVLDEALHPQPGYAYTITAPYHLRGLLGTPVISITPWQKEGGNTELPGQGPATIAFLDWAAEVRTPGNSDLDHTLTADIDLTGIQWEPLYDYRGTFDGAGHTITGLTVNSEEVYTALFARTGTTATIKNLTLAGARIHTTYNTENDGYLGALVGWNSGIIENCHVLNSSITGGIGATGALAGYNYNSGTILACTATGCTVQGGYAAGGITGENVGTLIACHTNGGTVESTAARYVNYSYTGGIAGNVNSGTLTACYAAPTSVTAYGQGVITHSLAGGVVGSTGGTLTANYWKSPIPDITFGIGNGWNTNAEPTPDGLTPEVITAMNAAIDAYNAENANACQWKWSTEGIIPLD